MFLVSILLLVFSSNLSLAKSHSGVGTKAKVKSSLVTRLNVIRNRVTSIEQSLYSSLSDQKNAKETVKKIQSLLTLQREEKKLGHLRMNELEETVDEFEERRTALDEKVSAKQALIRKYLVSIDRSASGDDQSKKVASLELDDREKLEAPRRKLLSNLVDQSLKEMEALKIDLADLDELQLQIQDEKQQLTYLFQDLDEQESVLKFNQELQADLFKEKSKERMVQFQNYQRLKSSERNVEHLIKNFSARLELEHTTDSEREANKVMNQGVFARLKGKLQLPIESGKVLSGFGRAFDKNSGLYVFKKGIDISNGKKMPVRAVSAGRVAYSGELPGYGRVAIVDHGDHFYSLCAHLGELSKKAGEAISTGDVLGETDESGTPIYFEIRARNVAVNPLQWLSN